MVNARDAVRAHNTMTHIAHRRLKREVETTLPQKKEINVYVPVLSAPCLSRTTRALSQTNTPSSTTALAHAKGTLPQHPPPRRGGYQVSVVDLERAARWLWL
eukprot:3717720-Rhodomonas_salina.2